MKKRLQLLVWLCLPLVAIQGQDIHYTQFFNAPLNLNPALTGIFRGDTRFMANYRQQWPSVPVDYQTFTAAADLKFPNYSGKDGYLAAGLNFNYDQAGYSKLALAGVYLNASYTQALSKSAFATIGGQIGGAQRTFQTEELSFDSQYDPGRGVYDPTLATRENLSNTSNFFLDFSIGFNFRLQQEAQNQLVDELDKRNKLDVGLGVFHFNQPDQSFIEGAKSPLPLRISPYLLGTLMLGDNLDLVGAMTHQIQHPSQETLGMLGARLHINRRPGRQFAVQVGAGYRYSRQGDAWLPVMELFYNGLRVGFSYDINISDFNVATNNRGGPEISIRYQLLRNAKQPFKICPLI